MRYFLYGCVFVYGVMCFLVVNQGWYFNVWTASLPKGIYKKVDQAPDVGLYGASCLNDEIAEYGLDAGYLMAGKCPTGIMPVIKKISAKEGDVVSVIDNQLHINGTRQSNYRLMDFDSNHKAVRRFMNGDYKLSRQEYLLMSDYKVNSFDSRYFGAVSVLFVLVPVWTF